MTEALKAELAGRIAAKQVLVVVGTGVSLASTGGQGLASWKGLISDGLEECAERGLRDDGWVRQQKKLLEGDLDDLLGVAEQVSRRLGWKPTEPCDGNWNAWLRNTVGELRASQPEVIRAIRDLGAPIATLNYDNLLTEVTGRRPMTWQRAERWLPVLRGEDDAILHLHGHWDHPSSVVLGIRSYDAVMSGSLAQHLQRALASLQSLVFIGCSGTLEDPNFSALLAWMRQQLSGAEHSHYLLLRDGESLPIEVSLLREARLVQLHYGPSHADVEPFIRGIAPDASGRRRAGVNSAAGRPEPPKAVEPVRPAVHADDDMGPNSAPDGTDWALIEVQEEKATKALQQTPPFFGVLQDRMLFRLFRPGEPVPMDEMAMVRSISRCPAEKAQEAILLVRRALGRVNKNRLSDADQEAAEKAAANLYCLAVARLIVEQERDRLASRCRAGDYVIHVPTDTNIICAIIAMAVSGGELDLTPPDPKKPKSEKKLPKAKFIFDVKAPEVSEQLAADFVLAVCVKLFENDEEVTQINVDRGSSGTLTAHHQDRLMSKLEARLETLRDVNFQTVGIVVSGLDAGTLARFAVACRDLAMRHRLPLLVPNEVLGQTLFGISAEHLADRIAEFWEELRILRRDRTVEREDLAPSKPRGAPGMPSTGHTFNIGNLSGGLAVGGGEGSVAQSGIGHTAHVENRLGADLGPILAQLGETIRTLTHDQTRTMLEAHLKCASDEAKGPNPDAGSINDAVKKIELGARGATAAARIADLCKRAYDTIGPYLS